MPKILPKFSSLQLLFRERFFSRQWKITVEQCEKSFQPEYLEQVQLMASWNSMQEHALEPAGIPYEIASIRPTLNHLYEFTRIFETQLAPGLQADFFWGITGVLLKVCMWLSVSLLSRRR